MRLINVLQVAAVPFVKCHKAVLYCNVQTHHQRAAPGLLLYLKQFHGDLVRNYYVTHAFVYVCVKINIEESFF